MDRSLETHVQTAYEFLCRGPQLGDSEQLGPLELDAALRRLGVQLPEDDLAAMIAEVDTDGDGVVSLEEFAAAMEPNADSAEAIATQLGGTKAERALAYGQLDELAARYRRDGAERKRLSAWCLLTAHAFDVGVALKCAEPLWQLLCRDADEVDRDEYMRVGLLCAALAHVDPLRIGSEFFLGWAPPWEAEGTVLSKILVKSGAKITSDDVLLVACQLACAPEAWQASLMWHQLGIPEQDAFKFTMLKIGRAPYFRASPGDELRTTGASRNARMVELAQALLQSDEVPLGSEFVKPGLCLLIAWSTVGRPDVSKALIERGFLEWAVKTLSTVDPCHWVACSGQADSLACGIIWCLKDATTEARVLGVDLEDVALNNGIVDLCLNLLAAHETLGNRPDTNNGLLVYAMWMLSSLDYRRNRALTDKVRGRMAVLKYHCDHPTQHACRSNIGTGSWGAVVIANVSGREENERTALDQVSIDGAIAFIAQLTYPTPDGFVSLCRCTSCGPCYVVTHSPCQQGHIWPLDALQVQPILNLCISDVRYVLILVVHAMLRAQLTVHAIPTGE
eukprot:COSAG02_NODE_3989_length_5943_cov_5.761636_7_plen_564_part_00